METTTLILSTSPHIKGRETVPKIMLSVVITLVPAIAYSIYQFGLYTLALYVVSVATCLAAEYLVVRLRKRPFTLTDYSALLTGILLVMVLPPRFPIYGVILGAVVAIVIGKQIFGGLGYNIFNPALIGRAFLAATYPVYISSYIAPKLGANAVSAATPLASMKFDGVVTPLKPLFFGMTGGSIGETSAFLLIVGSLYLIAKKYIKWRIPASIFLTVFVLGEIFHLINPGRYPSGFFYLCAGGLMIGGLYMATDMVTSPLTKRGCVIFGAGIGVLVIIIRIFGGLPEGVMYAILFMNALVPLINRATKPRIFGTGSKNEQ
jgi:electron transport complex protein RnfD